MAQRSTAASSGVRLVNSLVAAIARGQHDATHLSSIMSSSDVTNEVVLYLAMREAGRIGRAAIPDDQHMDKDEVLWCALSHTYCLWHNPSLTHSSHARHYQCATDHRGPRIASGLEVEGPHKVDPAGGPAPA